MISKINLSITLDKLIKEKENQFFEKKSIRYKPAELAEDIIAFANASGGLIVVGISNENVEDIKSLDNTKYNNFFQVCHDYITPPPPCKIEEIKVDGKSILLYHIQIDCERMFERKDNKKVFLRVGDEKKNLTTSRYKVYNMTEK